MDPDFTLDRTLSQESSIIADLTLSRVLLHDQADFPWLILVPRRAQLVEITDLSALDQAHLWREVALVITIMKQHLGAYKVNVGALGNVVRQLHIHVIARYQDDKAWPSPVWGRPRTPYTPEQKQDVISRMTQWIEEGVDHV
ncbi:MAG: HIT domain-containing protein [Alphaproteobacteria bacterium]|nr:HIT domain-containing protein [Alphaproteobacteria bacterium]